MKVVLINNIFPHYRSEIWEKLIFLIDFKVEIFFGNNKSDIFEINNSFSKNNCIFKNIYIKNILVWQIGVIPFVLQNNFDVYIFNGESNCLSTWISAFILKLRNKKIIFWGHGIYGNEKYIIKYFRILFNMLPDIHLLYSDYSKSLLSKYVSNKKIFVIKNSINYYKSKKYRFNNLNKNYSDKYYFSSDNNYLLFIGRITIKKKIYLLIDALNLLDDKFVLIIVGNGHELKNLKNYILQYKLENRVSFFNEIYDEEELSYIISNSDLMVSPGNVGLNVIHSLQYGTPVCTHDNFSNQMPEFESIIPFQTGFFFKENDHNDLAKKIDFWFNNYYKNAYIKKSCYEMVDNYYNPDYQIKVFKNAINKTNA